MFQNLLIIKNKLFTVNNLQSVSVIANSVAALQSQDSCNKNEITTSNAPHSPRNDKLSSRFTLHSSLKKKAAFTLAEVLITLGIIGVVAAITIPSLVNDYREKQTVTRFKWIYSILGNAFTMAVSENDTPEYWNLNAPEDMANILSKYMTVSEKCHYKKGCMSQDIKEVALSGELRYDSPADYTNMVKERFNNGIVLRYNNPHNGCSYKYIHTDGKEHTQENNCGMITAYVSANKINRRGLDNFVFVVTPKGIFPVGYDYPDSSVKRICSKENKLGDTGNIVSNGETCGEWIRRWDNADYWYN